MKRVLCLWFPQWPIQRLLVAQPELKGRAVILHARQGSRGERVTACSWLARQAGICPEMPLAEATAVLRPADAAQPGRPARRPGRGGGRSSAAPPFHTAAADPAADREALLRLAEWCERFSPIVGLESSGDVAHGEPSEPEGLALDVTGLGPLFGGEASLGQRILRELGALGYVARAAIADTWGTAWGVAHGGVVEERGMAGDVAGGKGDGSAPVAWVIPSGEAAAWLGKLPVEVLRLPAGTVELLGQLGVRQVDQLLRLPRASLSSRFGPGLLSRLDQALGSIPEPLTAHRPPPSYEAAWLLEEPTDQRATVEFVIRQLIGRVSHLLAEQQRGAVRLNIRLRCVAGGELSEDAVARPAAGRASLASGRIPPSRRDPPPPTDSASGPRELALRLELFRPTASAPHLVELTELQWEQVACPAAVQEVAVQATLTAPLQVRQGELFGSGEGDPRELTLLIDRLTSRLGHQRVLRPRLIAEAQPERACRYTALGGQMPRRKKAPVAPLDSTPPGDATDRPLHLVHPPEELQVLAAVPDGPPARFLSRHRWFTIVRHWGPERIETGWWRGATVRRDYFRVETADGQQFWLFRRLTDGRWFLQGEFA